MNAEHIQSAIESALDEVTQGGLNSARDIDLLTKLLCALEKVQMIGGEGGSYGGSSYDNNYRSYRGYSRGGSYDNGYSGHDVKTAMRQKMEELMNEVDSEKDRRMVREMLSKLR